MKTKTAKTLSCSSQSQLYSENQAGDKAFTVGDLYQALYSYKACLDIAHYNIHQHMSVKTQADFVVSLSKIASVVLELGCLKDADFINAICMNMTNQLHMDHPCPATKRNYAIALQKCAYVKLISQDITQAKALHQRAVRIFEDLHACDNSSDAILDLAMAYMCLAKVHLYQQKKTAALSILKQGSDVLHQHLTHKQNISFKSIKIEAFSCDINALIALLEEDRVAAAQAYLKALSFYKRIAQEQPNPDALQNLAMIWNNVGALAFRMDKIELSLKAHKMSLAIRKKLSIHSRTPETQRDVCVSHYRIAQVYIALKSGKNAAFYFEKALQSARMYQAKTFNEKDAEMLLHTIMQAKANIKKERA
ncbi:MAG: hypothetical protein AAF228_14015 [Pseudomonadota bacterium]